jgi:hypothetical protein
LAKKVSSRKILLSAERIETANVFCREFDSDHGKFSEGGS